MEKNEPPADRMTVSQAIENELIKALTDEKCRDLYSTADISMLVSALVSAKLNGF